MKSLAGTVMSIWRRSLRRIKNFVPVASLATVYTSLWHTCGGGGGGGGSSSSSSS